MKIKLNCLNCGHSMDLADAYEDYHGEVRCWGCQAVVEVTLHEGRLQSMTLLSAAAEPQQVQYAPEILVLQPVQPIQPVQVLQAVQPIKPIKPPAARPAARPHTHL